MEINEFQKIMELVRKNLLIMHRDLEKFSDILTAEYQALASHSIDKLEKTIKAKQRSSLEIEQSRSELNSLLSQLINSGQWSGQKKLIEFNLSSLKTVIKKISTAFASSTENTLIKDVSSIEALIERCLNDFYVVKEKVAKNRVIISKLLRNHQNSYSFWQSLAEEVSGSYSKLGKKKAIQSISQFSTKA